MERTGKNLNLTPKKVAGLILLLTFSLVFIFSCTCGSLPLGRGLVGTFGYLIFPLSLIFGFIGLAMFLGFSYSRRLKPTVFFFVALVSVLLVVHSIATYKSLNAIVNAETLKAYLDASYTSFTLLGSFGSIFSGLIGILLGGMGSIVVFVILATIFIGLFVDFQFYGKYEQPHIKKLKNRKLREKVYISDEQKVGENRPNYSFESAGEYSNDDVLGSVSVNANEYENYADSKTSETYNQNDVVGEISNSEQVDENPYVTYGNQNVTSFYTGTPSSSYDYQSQNYFDDTNVSGVDNSEIPDVYDYNANEQRRKFINATFGMHEDESNQNFGNNNYVNNGYGENYAGESYTDMGETNQYNENLSGTNNYTTEQSYNSSSYNPASNYEASNDINAENLSIDDEIKRILNSSEDGLEDEVKSDFDASFANSEEQNTEPSNNDFGLDIFGIDEPENENFASNDSNFGLKSEPLTPSNEYQTFQNYTNSSTDAMKSSGFASNMNANKDSSISAAKPVESRPQSLGSFVNSLGGASGLSSGLNSSNNFQSSGNLGGLGKQNTTLNVPVVPAAKVQKSPYSFNIGVPGLRYNPPPLSLLRTPQPDNGDYTEEQERKSAQLENVLAAFNIPAKVKNIVRGPKITRYELSVPLGVSVKKIPMFENDIAAALAAKTIVIKAPIPGSSYVGIELENDTFSSVYERELLESDAFQNFKDPLPIAIGKDISGEIVVRSLAKMVHLLIAGSTGSGKSVFIHNIVLSLIYKSSPDDLRLIMIDPKKVEFNRYNGLPHLLTPEVVMGADKAINALKWAVKEMQRRYDLLSKAGYNNIEPYNRSELVKAGQFEKMPYIVIIVDELAEIMMANKKEVEACIQSLTQLARACGMHMILATQRPSVDIISGVIKNNVPSRIAFSLQSGIDSKTILNSVGAEKLLGQGDMIFAPTGTSATPRLQAAYASDDEIKAVIDYDIKYNSANYDESVNSIINAEPQPSADEVGGSGDGMPPKGGVDEYFKTALKLVMQNGGASVSYLQRRLSIGYSRAARIVDQMEDKGYIAGATGAKVRKVLITPEQFREEFGEDFNDIND